MSQAESRAQRCRYIQQRSADTDTFALEIQPQKTVCTHGRVVDFFITVSVCVCVCVYVRIWFPHYNQFEESQPDWQILSTKSNWVTIVRSQRFIDIFNCSYIFGAHCAGSRSSSSWSRSKCNKSQRIELNWRQLTRQVCVSATKRECEKEITRNIAHCDSAN